MELKTLTPDDYDAILSVWQGAGLGHKPLGRDSRAEIVRQMAMDPEMWLGCFIGDELVGMILGSYESRKGWLNRLAVLPEHRRKGIARALVGEMESRLKARGFRIIAVLIEDGHDASTSLFLDKGYKVHNDIKYLTKREDQDV